MNTDNRNLLRWAGLAFALLVLCAAAVAALLVWALPQHIGSISINGEELTFGPATTGHWLIATLGVLAALVVGVLVVPFALLLGVALPLLLALIGVMLGALAIAIVFGLLFSPLLLGGWLLWRATRSKPTPGPATIER